AGRAENAALLQAFWHHLGAAGVVAAVALVAAVLATSIARLRSRRELDEWTSCTWSWASVALLPIAWIYSLLPLVPALSLSLRRGAAGRVPGSPRRGSGSAPRRWRSRASRGRTT